MRVLVACEESQAVTIECRKLGHEAYSCDLEPCSGGHPEWHRQEDVLGLLNEEWDIMFAFPTCTYLTNAGVRHLHDSVSSRLGTQTKVCGSARWVAMYEGAMFFKKLWDADIPKICIENPIPHKYSRGYMGDYTQLIQPWQFGHPETKATCLWLKNLPLLQPTNNVYEEMMALPKSKRNRIHHMAPSADRAKLRSKTYLGIAKALAEQYCGDNR